MRDQADSDSADAEQGSRVDIATVPTNGEVKGPIRAGHDLAPGDNGPSANRGPTDEAVGGPQTTGVIDAHEDVAPDLTSEGHDTVGRGLHDLVGSGVVLDPAVAGAVGPVGKPERIENRRIGRR